MLPPGYSWLLAVGSLAGAGELILPCQLHVCCSHLTVLPLLLTHSQVISLVAALGVRLGQPSALMSLCASIMWIFFTLNSIMFFFVHSLELDVA